MTAADPIRHGREVHPAFVEDHHPDPLLLGALGRYERQLLSRACRLHGEAFSLWETIALPLANYDAGQAVAAAILRFSSGDVFYPTGVKDKFTLVPWDDRFHTRLWPAGAIVSGTLYLLGQEVDWNGFSSVRLRYVPLPTAPAALTSTLTLPDQALDVLAAYLAYFMANRGPDGPDVVRTQADWLRAEAVYLEEVAATGAIGQESPVPDVW